MDIETLRNEWDELNREYTELEVSYCCCLCYCFHLETAANSA